MWFLPYDYAHFYLEYTSTSRCDYSEVAKATQGLTMSHVSIRQDNETTASGLVGSVFHLVFIEIPAHMSLENAIENQPSRSAVVRMPRAA